MIQRIQTLYVIIGTMSIVFAFFKIPLFHCIDSTDSLYVLNNYYSATFIFLLTALSIFSFQNRKKQIRFVYLLSFLCTILLLWSLYNYIVDFASLKVCNLNMIVPICFFIGKVFYFLSVRGIKKDDELLESINRLR